jgi:hypothetical protein
MAIRAKDADSAVVVKMQNRDGRGIREGVILNDDRRTRLSCVA